MDQTSQKIIDATMVLIRDSGYVATTTKDIAKKANVNESTLFRKFKNKKDIVMHGLEQEKWRIDVNAAIFEHLTWELAADLRTFMYAYLERVTPDFVNLSIGLRAPQIYMDVAPFIMQVPQNFIALLTEYLQKMAAKGKIPSQNFDKIALTIFSSVFGYTFLKASFGNELTSVEITDFIAESVPIFCQGILTNNT